MTSEQDEYEPSSSELGNCPNCGEVVLRDSLVRNGSFIYYWPCMECGYTHYGADIPPLE